MLQPSWLRARGTRARLSQIPMPPARIVCCGPLCCNTGTGPGAQRRPVTRCVAAGLGRGSRPAPSQCPGTKCPVWGGWGPPEIAPAATPPGPLPPANLCTSRQRPRPHHSQLSPSPARPAHGPGAPPATTAPYVNTSGGPGGLPGSPGRHPGASGGTRGPRGGPRRPPAPPPPRGPRMPPDPLSHRWGPQGGPLLKFPDDNPILCGHPIRGGHPVLGGHPLLPRPTGDPPGG